MTDASAAAAKAKTNTARILKSILKGWISVAVRSATAERRPRSLSSYSQWGGRRTVQSNPLNGSPDNGSIWLLVQVLGCLIWVLWWMVQSAYWFNNLAGSDAEPLSRFDCSKGWWQSVTDAHSFAYHHACNLKFCCMHPHVSMHTPVPRKGVSFLYDPWTHEVVE